jgi:hypothetical protein
MLGKGLGLQFFIRWIGDREKPRELTLVPSIVRILKAILDLVIRALVVQPNLSGGLADIA